ncbi:MAG: PAS domain S-box protein [Bacteroidetes bacterium]|nr:PAS domain S-box protein [Bacteroidota bacterium]
MSWRKRKFLTYLFRKIFEDRIKLNEIKYKDVFDKFQDIFIRATLLPDRESVITEVSESIFKFSGYKPIELIGKPSSMFYHNKKERDEMIKQLLKHKQIKDYPLTLIKKNGTPAYVQVTAQLVFEKEIPKEIRIIARDVSEKRNEEIRKEITYLIAKKTQRRIININSLAEFVHKILGKIIDTSNFHITLTNKENNTIDFIVFSDQKVKIEDVRFSTPIQNSLIEYIIETKAIFIKNEEELKSIIKNNNLTYKSPIPKILISFPLKNEGVVVGLLTVKSYKNENVFTKSDIDLLDFTATQLSNIIEKDQWQKSLINKEKYFRSLVESSLEVIGMVDENGKINYISESVKTILGYPAHYLIGKYFYDFIPEKYYEQSIEQLERIVYGKTHFNPFMVKVITKNKDTRIIQYTINNQLKNKEIKGIIFNASDITEKHQNEKKLRYSQEELIKQQENYKTIFDNANEGIIRFTKDFKIVDVNKRMIGIIGYSKNELLSKTVFDLTEKSNDGLVKNDLKDLLTKKITKILLEKKMVHKNGKNIICKIFIKPIFTDNNKFEYFIAFITDITKRNEAILKALEIEHALHFSSNVLYVDIHGNLLNASINLTNLNGYTRKELIGKNIRILNSGYHSKEFFKDLWNTVLAGKVWKGEIRNKRKDGSFYWIFSSVIPIKDLNNKVNYFIVVQNDMTALKLSKTERIREQKLTNLMNRHKIFITIH